MAFEALSSLAQPPRAAQRYDCLPLHPNDASIDPQRLALRTQDFAHFEVEDPGGLGQTSKSSRTYMTASRSISESNEIIPPNSCRKTRGRDSPAPTSATISFNGYSNLARQASNELTVRGRGMRRVALCKYIVD